MQTNTTKYLMSISLFFLSLRERCEFNWQHMKTSKETIQIKSCCLLCHRYPFPCAFGITVSDQQNIYEALSE